MRAVWPGRAHPRGATCDGHGVNFAVFSRVATRVEVCLYDPERPENEIARFDLPDSTGFTFHGYVPGLGPGALYGLRVHGPYAPARGLRCNPSKLLVDPYARALHGEIDWKQPIFGYRLGDEREDLAIDQADSAPGVPRSVVLDGAFDWEGDEPLVSPWRKAVIYEAHVRGLTRLHPAVPEEQRGTYAGLAHPAIIEHLKKLGVTALELLPVHAHASSDGGMLEGRRLTNYWGYSTLGFFAPEARYASDRRPGGAVTEFKKMVKALHAAGIEVILDVVYNHTCEGNHLGPTLSLRGIDNATYYWLMPEARYYLDFTGTGNSLDASNPETARLIADSLRYWATEMHVDGFRFDLATTLGRVGRGQFDPDAPLFQIIAQDPVISRCKLIVEPWDVGLGGYQSGNFPAPFREWNGKYRDTLRRYWKGDESLASDVGFRLAGSSDLFQGEKRRPQASINFVTAHDGFTLHDLVTYGSKHNEANGEGNQDGADDNQSWNHGVEGETADPAIVELRERQQRNLLATLFLSQGVPMMLGGDELGRTQRGNNNAYCQDNELSWVDWELDERRRGLLAFAQRLAELRHRHCVLQRPRFLVGDVVWDSTFRDIVWLRPDGEELEPEDWRDPGSSSFGFFLGGDAIQMVDERGERLIDDNLLVLMNPHHEPISFRLPGDGAGGTWYVELDTADPGRAPGGECAGDYKMTARSLVVLRQPLPLKVAREAVVAPARVGKREAARRRRRAGVVMPLFSIRSSSGWGLGEVPDIGRFASWAAKSGFSVLQLLPVGETSGADPSPYGAVSAFAIDPVYLSLDECRDFVAAGGRDALPRELQDLLGQLAGSSHVDWAGVRRLKQAGIELAFGHFLREECSKDTQRARDFTQFTRTHAHWLDDHALYRVFHDRFGTGWLEWPPDARDRDPAAIARLRREARDAILRVKWTQWQLDGQWRAARRAAAAEGVELMGDLPFVVGIDSSDVWAHRELFHTDLHVGTPPEEGAPEGQDWGLPAYDWSMMARDRFAWIRERSMRSGALYSMYRIDHVMGFYRTFYRSADGRAKGFLPPDEHEQIQQGETLMRLMGQWAEVVAEDLGYVPAYLRPSLERLGIPGYKVLRWEKDGDDYRDPATWPETSVSTSSTHDTDTLADWFDGLPPEQRERLRQVPGLAELGDAFDDRARDLLLKVIYEAPSALALVTFQDAMGTRDRINVPGTVDRTNWTFRASQAQNVEALIADRATSERLARLAAEAGREPRGVRRAARAGE